MKRTEVKTIGDVLNTALQKVISQDNLCKNCQLRHENNTCFFSFPCITTNHYYYKERR